MLYYKLCVCALFQVALIQVIVIALFVFQKLPGVVAFLTAKDIPGAVSYTHLDVYKRQ